jgi:hypothetical protein
MGMHSFGSLEHSWTPVLAGGRSGENKSINNLFLQHASKVVKTKLVTTSDEAFGILLFDKYIDKCKVTTAAATAPVTGGTGQDEANKKRKLRGKFTGKKIGHCKYGGWCHKHTTRFNELYRMVGEDRASA